MTNSFSSDDVPLESKRWAGRLRLSDAADQDGHLEDVAGESRPFRMWAREIMPRPHSLSLASETWFIECEAAGAEVLKECVDINPHKRGGVPVLKGTGFTVAQAMAELAESQGVDEVAENFDLDASILRKMLFGFALMLQRPRLK